MMLPLMTNLLWLGPEAHAIGPRDYPTCFPISQTIHECLARSSITEGRAFFVEEASVCASGAVPVAPQCQVVDRRAPQDAGVDWAGTLSSLAEVDPELAKHFEPLANQARVPVRGWSDEEIATVLREIVDAVRREAPAVGDVTIERVERGFRVVASPERLLDRMVDIDPASCPAASRMQWTVQDQERCALEQFAPDVEIPQAFVVMGAPWQLRAADGRVWHDIVLWEGLDEMYRGYAHGDKGFVLTIEDATAKGTTAATRFVHLRALDAPPPAPALAPIAIPPSPPGR